MRVFLPLRSQAWGPFGRDRPIATELAAEHGPIARETAHAKVAQLDGLTSLRFFAALLVLVFHYSSQHFVGVPKTGIASIGDTGVTFFFMLSGFILAYNYRDTDFGAGGAINRYLVSRLARIYPAYIFALLLALPFDTKSFEALSSASLKALSYASLALAPLGLHAWLPGAACALDCPSWSISTEFFFYLVFPLALPPILRRPGLWFCIAAAYWMGASAIGMIAWSRYGAGLSIAGDLKTHPMAEIASQFIKFFPPMRLPEFLFGIVLFAAWNRTRSQLSGAKLGLAAFVAWGALALVKSDIPETELRGGLTAIAWAPLILLGANIRSGLLVAPAMVFLGRISYSLYLTHVTVLNATKSFDKRVLGGPLASTSPWCVSIASALAALVLAAFVYRIVEDPARRFVMSGRWTRLPGSQWSGGRGVGGSRS